MELRQLEYFAAVVRHGHFGRAAREVFVTQSALSQQIRRLEDELGLTLLLRTSQGVRLTPAGVEFLDHVDGILGRVAEARSTIDAHAGALRGVARIAATPHDSRDLPEALITFHRAHPGVGLALRHGSDGQVVELLNHGVVDIGVVGVHGDQPAIPEALEKRVIRREPLTLIAAPGTVLTTVPGAAIDELRGRAVILPERGTALRELIAAACEARGFSPLPRFETSDPHTIGRLVGAGLGLGVVPRSWLGDASGELATAQLGETVPRYEVALLFTTAGRLPVRQLLVEHLTRALEQRD